MKVFIVNKSDPIIESFNEMTHKIENGEIWIYNEISVQHELTTVLQAKFEIVLLEWNVKNLTNMFTRVEVDKLEKKEMDIFIDDNGSKYCIEIKYPTSGQNPEQMFKACKDIKFLEQLVERGFKKSYFLMFASDDIYFNENSKRKSEGIFKLFRTDKLLKGTISKPTGKKDESITLKGKYNIEWKDVPNNTVEQLKYFYLVIQKE